MKRLLLALGTLASATLAAQSPAPTTQSSAFEVASIKRNTSGDGMIMMGFQPGRLTFNNMPVRQLIVRAYQVQPFQVVGGPSWIQSDRFDISTKAEGTPTPAEMNSMLQNLLADRFKLKVHKETRQASVYRLVKARDDGKLGEGMKPSTAQCGDLMRGRGAGPAAGTAPSTAPAQPLQAGAAPGARVGGPPAGTPGPGAPGGCQMLVGGGRVDLRGQSIANLANMLAGQLGSPVLDETGISGNFDITLSFMPEMGGRGGPIGPPPPGAPDLPPIDPNAPTLPTALQEQLGLKLESTKGPVEMIVIDSIEQPTEN